MLQGNVFETTLDAQPGVNTVTVEATDSMARRCHHTGRLKGEGK